MINRFSYQSNINNLIITSLFGSLVSIWSFYLLFGPRQIFAMLSLIVWCGFGAFIWKINKLAFASLLPIYLSQTFSIISNTYLERDVYIIEQQGYSCPTGGTLRLVSISLVFIVIATIVIQIISKKLTVRTDKSVYGFNSKINYIHIILFLVVTANVINICLFGSPLLLGIQRFDYWSQHPAHFFYNITSYLFIGCFYIGSLNASINARKDKLTNIAFIALIIVLNVLNGEKFTAFYLDFIYFSVGYYVTLIINNGKLPSNYKIISAILLLLIPLFLLVAWHYSNLHGIDPVSVVDFIFTRIFALQGHVWWGVDDIMSGIHSNAHIITGGNFGSSEITNNQIYNIMYEISPSNLVDSYAQRGITFSMLSPAVAVYYFGYAGALIYQAVGGFVYAIICMYLFNSVKNGKLLSAFVGVKLMLILTHIYNMGNWGVFFSLTFYFYITYAVFDSLSFFNNKIKLS